MKINRNVAQIGITALVTSAAFITYIVLSQHHHGVSEPITWSEAQTLMNDYNGRDTIMMTTYTDLGTVKYDKLRGFLFDKSDIMDVLTASTNGVVADTLLLMFGTENTFTIPSNNTVWPNMHIIALGSNNNRAITAGPIYDKADPCPPNCPR